MELAFLTLTEAANLVKRREVSPVELVQACLERIERLEPALNCFITLTAESALQKARQAEADRDKKHPLGPLYGVPIALKDLYEVPGAPTTAGSRFFASYIPESEAATVKKLLAAGAILLGKLNMHEIALGVTNINPHFGNCRNPWDLERITGGSSGGSAAALASGLCFGSLGSDTGGSIRIPASLCGVVGLKPTFGRVSLRGVIPLSWHLDHAGPMARTVRDGAVLLQVIAGYDALDPACIDRPVDDYLEQLEHGIGGWRIALPVDEFFAKCDPEVKLALEEAMEVLEGLGAEVHPVELEEARQAAQANGLMVTSDAAAFHRERLEASPQDFGEDVRQRLQTGAAYTSTEYILARRSQNVYRRQFEALFSDYDILVTPTTPVTAPLQQGVDAIERARQLTRFTSPFNLTGLPAISLPCGFTGQGLPIGLQMVCGPWSEARLLRAAYAYEQATPWHTRRPALP